MPEPDEQPKPELQTTVTDRTEDEDGDFTVTFTLHPRQS